MIQLLIDEKIVDAQLATGKTVPIRFITMFNNKRIEKVFPNDFSPEQQAVMKQIYDLAVYGSEVGNKVYRCSNVGPAIAISGFERTEPVLEGIEDFPADQQILLEFTRHGIETQSVTLGVALNEVFGEGHLEQLAAFGIVVAGTAAEFSVIDYSGDISITVVKGPNDSYIDLGDFKEGRIIFKK